ncbi:MAG: chemotaxis protein CheW [Planctomycetota bacterium]|nr:chemotaxis protein CheW [Planctomycetota bacterium]
MPTIENQQSQIENPTVWQRLRDQMVQMNAALSGQSDPEALAKKLSDRAKSLRHRVGTESTSVSPLTFVAFRKGPQRYGIPVSDVVEVQTLEHFSPVPGAPAFIPGVIHWRGSILSLLDLSRLFEIQETGIADLHTCLIVEVAGRRIAIAAGEIEELYDVPETQVKRVPELPGGIPGDWFIGVYDQNRLILKTAHLLEDPRFVESK